MTNGRLFRADSVSAVPGFECSNMRLYYAPSSFPTSVWFTNSNRVDSGASSDGSGYPLARFIRNLESRIYAQLSRQLVENLFGETPSDSGVLELEGNRIEYTVIDGIITLTITDSNGDTTTISLPVGNFTF